MKWPWSTKATYVREPEEQLIQFTFGSPLEAAYTIYAAVIGAGLVLHGRIPTIATQDALCIAAGAIGRKRLVELADEWGTLLATAQELANERADTLEHQ